MYFRSPSAHPCIAPARQNRTHAVNHVKVLLFYSRRPCSSLRFFFFFFPIACRVSTLRPPLPSQTKELHICLQLVNDGAGRSSGKRTDPCQPGSGSGFFGHVVGGAGRKSGGSLSLRRSPVGAEFREVFKDGFIHGIKVIFSTLISSPALISKYHLAHSCAVSTFYLKKINTSFFFSPPSPRSSLSPRSPGQIGVLLFQVRCPESSASFGM